MRKLLFLLLAAGSFALNAQQVICAGGTATIVATSTLSNPSYSLAPGQGAPLGNGTWVVSPGVTTTYTIIATSGSSTQSTPVTVTVNPQPKSVPTVTNMTCNTNTAAYNLNLTFNPATPAPSYTISWGGSPPNIPNKWTPGTTYQADTLVPGTYTANIVAAGGCSTSVIFSIVPQPPANNYSLFPLVANSVYSLTCNQKTITISATNPAYTYTFYSNTSAPMSGSAVAVTYTDSGNWSVVALNPGTGCATTKTFVVATNTAIPTRSANPSFQSVSCANPVPQTVTLTTNLQSNLTHSVISTVVPPLVAFNATVNYQPGPDTYTHYVINNLTGCFAVGQFTVGTSAGMPTFSVFSPQNFTLGCGTKSTAVITMSADIGGGAITFSLLSPGSSTVLPPFPAVLSTSNIYTVSAAGSWTGVARVNQTGCEVRFPFPVTQQTIAPGLDTLIQPRSVLNCDVPEVVITGISKTPNVEYQWTGPAGVVAGNNLTVTANPLQPTATLIANYVLRIMDMNNYCISNFTVPMKQNLFPPIPRIGSTGSLTCKSPTLELTMQGSTGIPLSSGYPTNSLVIGELWDGPSPQLPKSNSSSYIAEIQGTYSLTVKDLNNGCTSFTTALVGENKVVPLINNNMPWPTIGGVISCSTPANAPVTEVTVSISTPTANLDYLWTGPTNVSHTLALGSQTTPVLKTNRAAKYYILVSDRVNGCQSRDSTTVINGSLTASIAADHTTGFAPLAVEFFNNTSYDVKGGATSNASITTVWSFGNGLTAYTSSAQASPKTVYNHAGNYTVTAFIFAGVCADTSYQVISVDFASSMKVPNIFSPNGDNVNDVFFIKAVNLSEITLEIYNRWGQRIYSLVSGKGNIEWNGDNEFGEPAPEGVYLFKLRSKGTDGKEFEESGNITLVR